MNDRDVRDRREQETSRVLEAVDSNCDQCCVAIFNGIILADFTTIRYVRRVLQENFTIHTLSLARCNLSSDNVIELAVALAFHDKLESFDISCNHIGSSDIPTIVSHLRNIPSLMRLNLENINLGGTGAIAVVQHLLSHPRLDALNLARNSIGDHAVPILAPALIRSTLGWLDLSHNHITNKGATQLLHALRQRQQYLRLDLHGNPSVCKHILDEVMSHNMQWETALRLALEDDIHDPRPALPGQAIPSPPFSTLVRIESLRARLLESPNNTAAKAEVLWIQEGKPPHEAIPDEEDQNGLPMEIDVVPETGTGHRDVAAWEDIARMMTSNFHESSLVELTNTFQIYSCQRRSMVPHTAATTTERQLLLRRVNPDAPTGSVDRDEQISQFEVNFQRDV